MKAFLTLKNKYYFKELLLSQSLWLQYRELIKRKI